MLFIMDDIKKLKESIIEYDRQIKLSELKLQQLQFELEIKKIELEIKHYQKQKEV